MRRLAIALVALLAVACDSSSTSGEMCEEPTTVDRPVPESGSWSGDESHCNYVRECMNVLGCTGEDCAMDCAENVFGSADCGCCGPECDATCDEIIDLAVSLSECARDECSLDDAARCTSLNFPGRTP